ncbi:hypothetical protein NS365_18630 [Aureimonas ureilytica]|uniref:Conjugal transfer protein TraG n=1 Tax=Aureimonas ureilytica TaxID=401562 RepID=A0A175RI36_9HYPH|nr:type IV secretory system conjugative DNA transfer family protein [Aureimonas ureilytica]KTR03356.1 hypothetical protein NS365_18630 [Aureimonas ureilytica]
MKEWLLGMGKKAMDAGAARLEDEKQRRAEPPLTIAEDNQYARFERIRGLVHMDMMKALPPHPGEVTSRNRREVRAFLQSPAFADAVAFGEKARDDRQRRDRERELADQAERLAAINKFYDNELNVISVPLDMLWAKVSSMEAVALSQEFNDEVTRSQTFTGGGSGEQRLLEAVSIMSQGSKLSAGMNQSVIKRTLRDFPEGHRAILRLAEILQHFGRLTEDQRYKIALPLAWNEGKSQIEAPKSVSGPRERAAFMGILSRTILSKAGTAESAVETVQSACRSAMDGGVPSMQKEVLQRYLYSGTQWLTSDEAVKLAPNGATDTALRLGGLPDGKELLFDLNESLATIAPPGSGKSTSHVIRNLLYLKAPAVVLDIKGEVYGATGAWRQENVGPVYKFAPTDPANSLHFNPFDFISTDQDEAYDQAQRLAELLTTPPDAKKGGSDPYWDERAQMVISAFVLHVALTAEGSARSMDTVLEMLAGNPLGGDGTTGPYDETLSAMMVSDVSRLRRIANALFSLPDKQRESVFDMARNALDIWESPSIARLTRRTTFRPEQLRAENATLYLCVDLPDVKRFSSVLRVLLGMTITHLCTAKPESQAKPVTVFLDEMPRLKRMDVIEQALETGRGFGVRMWLFMQNFGQLETMYANARGMLSNCMVRAYMNPEEDTAVWLSKHLGEQNGLLDGQRKPLIPAYTLTGSEYADKMVLLINRTNNATLNKRPYFQDGNLTGRAAS